MKSKKNKHLILSIFCAFLLISNINILAQAQQNQTLSENRQVQQEVEMMRQMIRERRAQQEEQMRVLLELQETIGVDALSTQQHIHQVAESSHQPIHTSIQERTTENSGISYQVEEEESEAIKLLQQKYNMEIQVAQKEIEMLKKQLATANKQISQCHGSSLNANNNSFNNTTKEKLKPLKSVNNKEFNTEIQSQSQGISENMQVKQEIEAMRKMLRARREQQEQQLQQIRDLQQALN